MHTVQCSDCGALLEVDPAIGESIRQAKDQALSEHWSLEHPMVPTLKHGPNGVIVVNTPVRGGYR